MYNASLAVTKFSILFQYLRIFPSRSFRLACYIMMAVVATYSVWAIVTGYVNCVPVAKFWNHDLPGSCLSFEAIWFFNASMNIATDVTLLLMPMPMLIKLQLPKMQKVALIGVFAMGILYVNAETLVNCSVTNGASSVVITSILRLSSLRVVAKSADTSCTSKGNSRFHATTNKLSRQQCRRRLLDRGRVQCGHHLCMSALSPTHRQPHLPQTSFNKQLQSVHYESRA